MPSHPLSADLVDPDWVLSPLEQAWRATIADPSSGVALSRLYAGNGPNGRFYYSVERIEDGAVRSGYRSSLEAAKETARAVNGMFILAPLHG